LLVACTPTQPVGLAATLKQMKRNSVVCEVPTKHRRSTLFSVGTTNKSTSGRKQE
jgi:hypothetical protein